MASAVEVLPVITSLHCPNVLLDLFRLCLSMHWYIVSSKASQSRLIQRHVVRKILSGLDHQHAQVPTMSLRPSLRVVLCCCHFKHENAMPEVIANNLPPRVSLKNIEKPRLAVLHCIGGTCPLFSVILIRLILINPQKTNVARVNDWSDVHPCPWSGSTLVLRAGATATSRDVPKETDSTQLGVHPFHNR